MQVLKSYADLSLRTSVPSHTRNITSLPVAARLETGSQECLWILGRQCCMPAMTGCLTSRYCQRCQHCALSGRSGCLAPGSMWPAPRLPRRLRLRIHTYMFLSASICAACCTHILCCLIKADLAANRFRRRCYRRVDTPKRTVSRSTRSKGAHALISAPALALKTVFLMTGTGQELLRAPTQPCCAPSSRPKASGAGRARLDCCADLSRTPPHHRPHPPAAAQRPA